MKKPSVSSICDILNKPALIGWANKLGLAGQSVNGFSRAKMDAGTKKHSEVGDFLINGVCLEDDFRQDRLSLLFGDAQIISIEEAFEAEKYKGRTDIRFIKNGINYIGDFKSKFRKPYLEHYLQLICYKMHFGCDRICIIDIRDFQIHELSLEHEKEYEEMILNLVNIYNLQQKIQRHGI